MGEMWDDAMNEAHAKWTLCSDKTLKIKLYMRSAMRYVSQGMQLLQAMGIFGGGMPQLEEQQMMQEDMPMQMQQMPMQQMPMQQQQRR
jgi:hypothetical protein